MVSCQYPSWERTLCLAEEIPHEMLCYHGNPPDFTCIREVSQGAAEGTPLQTFTSGIAVVEACSAQVTVARVLL